MKAGVWDRVRLVRDMPAVASARETIPAGTLGTVVEVYSLPAEGYAVDVAIPNPQSVTSYDTIHCYWRPTTSAW